VLNRYYWGSPEGHQAIQETFRLGQAILAESDTVWGLFAPATIVGAAMLDQLKRRRDKPYLVIMDSINTAAKAVYFPQNGSYALAQAGWPGPLTLLCPALENQLLDAQSAVGVVGIRVPDHDYLRQLAALYGGFFSTSANISGELIPLSYDHIDPSIKEGVGVVIYNQSDYKPSLQPSTIVDCTGSELRIVRHGAYPVIL
jgi:L-threonylcarbamoyladenylate synthase